MDNPAIEPAWLRDHRETHDGTTQYSRSHSAIWRGAGEGDPLVAADAAFNSHLLNDGTHVSPYDDARIDVGTDNLVVNLIQGVDGRSLRKVLTRALHATTGLAPDQKVPDATDEMFRGGLQAALETQTLVFEVIGASRALTHQLVRSRRAGFHQQSQRATWYGDRPNVRMPVTATVDPIVRTAWTQALLAAWDAYKLACDRGVSYQDARFILPEGTESYILCEYTVREFIAVFAYRGCSMFMWEMVDCMRKMRSVLLDAHPFLAQYVKISCEKGTDCVHCGGTGVETINDIEEDCCVCNGIGSNRRCTFQGWENVEKGCDFPWARQSNRTFLPTPQLRIGG